MFFDFAGDFVGQLDDSFKRCIETYIVFAGVSFGNFWVLEVVILETKFELLPGVVFDWVNLGKNLTKTSLDELFPRVELV